MNLLVNKKSEEENISLQHRLGRFLRNCRNCVTSNSVSTFAFVGCPILVLNFLNDTDLEIIDGFMQTVGYCLINSLIPQIENFKDILEDSRFKCLVILIAKDGYLDYVLSIYEREGLEMEQTEDYNFNDDNLFMTRFSKMKFKISTQRRSSTIIDVKYNITNPYRQSPKDYNDELLRLTGMKIEVQNKLSVEKSLHKVETSDMNSDGQPSIERDDVNSETLSSLSRIMFYPSLICHSKIRRMNLSSKNKKFIEVDDNLAYLNLESLIRTTDQHMDSSEEFRILPLQLENLETISLHKFVYDIEVALTNDYRDNSLRLFFQKESSDIEKLLLQIVQRSIGIEKIDELGSEFDSI